MSYLLRRVLFVCMLLTSFSSYGKLKVITTTANLKSLVKEVAKDLIEVESFCRGTQDPHFLEAKPSYMLKASKADLLVSIGLDLEVGWLPLILRGARNPKLRYGGKGSFVAGDYIQTMDKPTAKLTRADGDVHPEGNPHLLLDPLNTIVIAEKLKNKFIELDAENSKFYEKNFKDFSSKMHLKIDEWKKRVTKGTKVVTYHKTLTYFYNRFDIQNVDYLEPKPGVPPSASHILGVIKKASNENVKIALVENYFDPAVALRIGKSVNGLEVKIVPVSVEGEKGIKDFFDLFEKLVSSVGRD